MIKTFEQFVSDKYKPVNEGISEQIKRNNQTTRKTKIVL